MTDNLEETKPLGAAVASSAMSLIGSMELHWHLYFLAVFVRSLPCGMFSAKILYLGILEAHLLS